MRVVITNMCLDGNRGDLAILAGTVSALRRVTSDPVVTVSPIEVGLRGGMDERMRDSAVVSDEPLLPSPVPNRRDGGLTGRGWAVRMARAYASERLGMRVLEEDQDRLHRGVLASADLVVAKGGSWLFSYPTPQQFIFTHRMLHPLRVAQSEGVPTTVLGTSLGPWQPLTRMAYKRTLGRCSTVVVRERLSLDFARRVGLTNLVSGVDMAFALYEEPRSGARQGIAITPRELPYVPAEARRRYEQAVAAAARRLIDETGEECLLATQVDEDLPLCERLVDLIDRPGAARVASEVNALSLDQLIGWYGARQMIIGTRIHSVILAAMAHTPSVILECDPPKMVGLSEQMGLDRFRIPAAGPEVAELGEVAMAALRQRDQLEQALVERIPALAERAVQQTEEVVTRAMGARFAHA